MAVTVDHAACTKDHECTAMAACPFEALSQADFNPPAVDDSLCSDCGVCVDSCPASALQLS